MKNAQKSERWFIPEDTEVEFGGIKYTYSSGITRLDGMVYLLSRERGVKCGDTRVINGKLFYANSVFERGPLQCSSIYWHQIHNENT